MKKTYGSLALLALLNSAQAFDYQAHGGVEFFTKIGFNNQGINAQSPNIYPTDTWGSVVARAQVDMDFLTDEQKASGHSLTGSFGVLGGGVIFDLTKDASGNKTYSELFSVGRGDSIVGKEYIADNFVIYNAYLDYTTKIRDHSVEIKVGRYKSKAQFHSGFTQGFEIDYAYKNFNLWWFSSYGRAFAYSEWLYDFYTPKKHGNTYYGVHIFKPSYSAYGFFISPWLQFSPDFYFTPILELGYDSNPGFQGSGFRSQSKIFFMSPFHTTYAQQDYRYQFIAGKGGQTLAIQQRFDINNFNFGLGWYQNFGNANAHFGTYGNAAIGPWDFWTNTVYDFGALTNAITKDAKTGYIYVGATHGKFSWDILGRITHAIRANEYAIPLNLTYAFNDNFKIWLKLEWQSVTTHKEFVINDQTGINPNAAPYKDNQLKASRTDDRSHIMMNVSYSF